MSYQPLMHKETECYDSSCTIQIAFAKGTLDKYFSIVGKSSETKIKGRVLDVACGTGRVTKTVLVPQLDATATLDACDISQEVLDYAVGNTKEHNINFFQQDINKPFPDNLKGQYDFIFCNCVLHWIKEQRPVLESFHSLLKNNGTMIMCAIGNQPLYDAYRILARSEKWGPYLYDVEEFISPYHDDKNADTLRSLMSESGFKEVYVELLDVSKFHFNELTYGTFRKNMKIIDPFIERIPDDEKELYFNTLMEKSIEIDIFRDFKPETTFEDYVSVNGILVFGFGVKK